MSDSIFPSRWDIYNTFLATFIPMNTKREMNTKAHQGPYSMYRVLFNPNIDLNILILYQINLHKQKFARNR